MRGVLRLVAAAAFAFVSGAAGAAMDQAKVAAAKKAGDDFVAMAKGSETSGKVPRQADPKVKTGARCILSSTTVVMIPPASRQSRIPRL